MSHTFKLKYGSPASWSTIDLTDYGHGRVNYTPGTAAEGADDLTESAVWRIGGTSKTDLVAKIQAIENVFRRAAEYDRSKIGQDQVYLTAQLDGTIEIWESPIYEGRVELPADALGLYWKNLVMPVTLIWRRAPWWEQYIASDNIAGYIPIRNSNYTGVINHVKISNNNDGSGSAFNQNINTATVTAVPGDLPFVARVQFGLPFDTTAGIDKVVICQNAKAPNLAGHATFEGETGVFDTTDATRSAGAYHSYTIAAGATGTLMEWTHASLRTIYDGTWLRCFLSAKVNGTVKITPYMLINGVKYFGTASVVTAAGANFGLYDLGLLNFPPIDTRIAAYTGYSSVYYGIWIVSAAGATVGVDYADFVPTDSCIIAKLDSPASATWVVEINSYYNLVVAVIGSSDISCMGAAQGRLTLTPGVTNYLYFKWTCSGIDNQTLFSSFLPFVTLSGWARKRTL
jgi:hypothetical protein